MINRSERQKEEEPKSIRAFILVYFLEHGIRITILKIGLIPILDSSTKTGAALGFSIEDRPGLLSKIYYFYSIVPVLSPSIKVIAEIWTKLTTV